MRLLPLISIPLLWWPLGTSGSPFVARRVEITQLNPDNFPTLTRGLVFIEYYLPTCPHCIAFAPKWQTFCDDAKIEMPNVLVAQVNCGLYGDLCNNNHIQSYPTIVMLNNGESTTYSGDRSVSDLKRFANDFVKSTAFPEEPQATANPNGVVAELTDATFALVRSKGNMFVKFFAPWCGHCKKLAPAWKQLAKHMQHKLTIAEVNCDEYGALCKSQNIEGYPTLLYFPIQGERIEYTGSRAAPKLKEFTEDAIAAGVKGIQPEQLDILVAEHNVLYLLLHSDSDTKIIDKVHKAAVTLLSSPPVFSTSAPALFERFSVPKNTWALVALKDHDANSPSSIFYGRTSTDEKLKFWLLSHRLGTTTELTQDTFQKVMNAPQEPLVVIAAITQSHKSKVEEHFRDIGKKWRIRTSGTGVVHAREVVFTWMDIDQWADWMKSMYGITKATGGSGSLDDVPVVISDHKRLIYYDNDPSGSRIRLVSSASLFSAVEAAAANQLSYKHSENLVERVARYLNTKMTFLVDYVVTNPILSALYLFILLCLVFWGLKWLITNDLPPHDEYRASKAHRLD